MKLLTVKQAADQSSCSRSLLYAVLRDGKLAALRVGCRGKGKWLIEQAALDAWLAACRAEVKPALPPLRHIRV